MVLSRAGDDSDAVQVEYSEAGRAFYPATPHLGSTAAAAALAALYIQSIREADLEKENEALVQSTLLPLQTPFLLRRNADI